MGRGEDTGGQFIIRTSGSFEQYYYKIKILSSYEIEDFDEYTPAVRSNILSKLIFASCVWFSDRAYYGLCVLIENIGRRLPLHLQCSYQSQQGDVSQSVRGNTIKPVFEGDKIWQLVVEGNASVNQGYPVSSITGEERAEFSSNV